MPSELPLLFERKSLTGGKKLFFASDFHLGAPDNASSRAREIVINNWLDSIKDEAEAIFLVGDIFDFWFEYKQAVPRGFTRFISKLTELRDLNIPIYFFTGNHDMWMFNYFPDELGIPIVRNNVLLKIGDDRIFVGHGDGLGPGDNFYKILKWIFANSIFQWLFERLHPNFGIGIASFWSKKSRVYSGHKDEYFDEASERLLIYSKKIESRQHHDYYIFGHRHLPLELPVGESSRYVNLGEWVNYKTFATFDGKELKLKAYEG